MIVFGFILIYLILTFITSKPLFAKAGVDASKALIPGLNFVEWATIIGKPKKELWWLLFPIVNIFTFTGMCVDMVRSFKRYKYIDTALAVLAAPVIFYLINKNDEAYDGPTLPKEAEMKDKYAAALKAENKVELAKLDRINPYKKSFFRDFAESIFYAVFAAAFIRMFLIEAFVIPTSSMEGSLLIGDYLFVSKAHYGIRTPMTVAQIPLLHNENPLTGGESYTKSPSFPYFRLPALQSIQRDKPIVFNWPAGDSVIKNIPGRSGSYSVAQARKDVMSMEKLAAANNLSQEGFSSMNMFKEKLNNEIVWRPVDKRDHYIKRCVAIAGDQFQIKDRQIYINGKPSPVPEFVEYNYKLANFSNIQRLDDIGVNVNEGRQVGPNDISVALTKAQIENVKAMGTTPELIPNTIIDDRLFPFDTANYKWSMDNYGPFTVPAAGATVQLDKVNIALYRRIISVYEGNKLEEKADGIYINGAKASTYTFKMNYYWAMGDNRHNSEDSRFWGFVPEDHVVGRPLFIWFSTKHGNIRDGINWSRIFTSTSK